MAQSTPSNDPSAYLPTVPSAQGYPPAGPAPAAAPADPRGAVLARLPLQIGTTSAWSAGRAAASLFPGFALVGAAISLIAHMGGVDFRVVLAIMAVGVLLVLYAVGHMRSAVQTRASDVLLFSDGLAVDGGRLHGHKIPWAELTAPYAEM